MKFLVDNQLPAALARWLSTSGWDAVHVLDLKLNQADDRDVWNYARANQLIVVSKDEDFSNRASASSGSLQVVWVRLGNCRNKALLAAFEQHMPSVVAALRAGTSVVELWPA